jgi:SPP1 family predicted phage head-tail adaptor
VSHRVTLRFIPGVTAKMRVNYGGRLLLIEAALNIEERNRELQLMCLEVV